MDHQVGEDTLNRVWPVIRTILRVQQCHGDFFGRPRLLECRGRGRPVDTAHTGCSLQIERSDEFGVSLSQRDERAAEDLHRVMQLRDKASDIARRLQLPLWNQ